MVIFSLINFNCLAFCNRLTFLLTFLFDLWHFIALSWSKWQFHHDNDYLGSKKSIGPRDFADFSSPKLAYKIQHQAWLNSGWERFIISANMGVPHGCLYIWLCWCYDAFNHCVRLGCLWLLLHWPSKSLWWPCTCYYFYRCTSYCVSISLCWLCKSLLILSVMCACVPFILSILC